MTTTPPPPGNVTCAYCGQEIDLEVCCCGELRSSGFCDNHHFVPAGCRCGVVAPKNLLSPGENTCPQHLPSDQAI